MSEDINIEKFFHENDIKVHELSKQIPNVKDVTLIVIKGHLVVERCMYEILQAHMNHPKYLEQARFSFAQLLQLVKAISKIPPHENTFGSIKKLNSLRNHLAHNLPNEKTDKMIDEFIDYVGVHIDGHSSRAQKVWDQIYSMLGSISILISVTELISSDVSKTGLVSILQKLGAEK
jgi:hypothetical protein